MSLPTLAVEELKEMLDRRDRFILLDVRPASIFWQGHIRGAVNIPFERLNDLADERLDQSQPLVIYGHDERDVTPSRAGEVLAGRRFRISALLDGGFVKWRGSGYLTDGGDT